MQAFGSASSEPVKSFVKWRRRARKRWRRTLLSLTKLHNSRSVSLSFVVSMRFRLRLS
jgi:hypothetical protein